MPRTPISYLNTVIYKIVCKDLNIKDIYVGHTTEFTRRKSTHKCNCCKDTTNSYNTKVYASIRENGGWDNWEMIEIEKYPCSDANEAKYRERHWYEQLNADLNSRTPIQSDEDRKQYLKQYQIDNKDKRLLYLINNKEKLSNRIQIYGKKYNQINKENIYNKRSIQFNCECGSHYSKGNKSTHFKTKNHLKYLESL
jgi:hypothetical protein